MMMMMMDDDGDNDDDDDDEDGDDNDGDLLHGEAGCSVGGDRPVRDDSGEQREDCVRQLGSCTQVTCSS